MVLIKHSELYSKHFGELLSQMSKTVAKYRTNERTGSFKIVYSVNNNL